MRLPKLLLAAAAAALVLPSCLIVQTPGPVFGSEPAGARLLVDGRDTGLVTPCMVALDDEEPHVVTLALEGYEPREFTLIPQDRNWVVGWTLAASGVRSTITFATNMPAWDLFFPLRHAGGTTPGRVFARLRPVGTSE